MASGQRPGDFVGYPVGIPHTSPAPTVGYVGLLDFVGFSVGLASTIPPIPPTSINAGASILRRRRIVNDDDEAIILISQQLAQIFWKKDD